MNDNNEVLIAAAASKEQSWYRRHWNDNNYRNDVGITSTTKQSLSLEERKMIIKNRIAILQDQNNSNNKKTNTQTV